MGNTSSAKEEDTPANAIRKASVSLSALENEYLRMFHDTCKSGTMSRSELESFLRKLGLNLKPANFEATFANVPKLNGKLSPSGFVQFMHTYRDTSILEKAFALFDLDGNGRISSAELRACAIKLGESMSVDEASSLVKLVDTDSDLMINFQEYIQMMLQQDDYHDIESVLTVIESQFGCILDAIKPDPDARLKKGKSTPTNVADNVTEKVLKTTTKQTAFRNWQSSSADSSTI